ncbi:MAG: tRNA (N(6)-L-threonylcarbamoyladenosine(37)-C(2))-methylthiotransferase MtaB [Bacillota bacterium]
MKKVAFYTLGCKVNQYETEGMINLFKKSGYEVVNFQDEADYYIINSCTVTNQAASKSRKRVRRAKRRNPEAKVVMVGCYPQAFTSEVEEIKEVDYIIGSSGKKNIVELLEKKENEDNIFLSEMKEFDNIQKFEDMHLNEINERTRANIKIEDGCNQFCSYCIIPYARGPIKSRESESIIKEIKKLINKDIKEIVLTGTHLGKYGLDKNKKNQLSKLVEKIVQIKGDFRLRLSSIEVTEIDSKLIYLIKESQKLCSHLHLPLQNGSNAILRAMNRPYTVEEFSKVINILRNEIPDIAITTDVIVGFPGESDKDFERTINFVKKINFSRLHVFPFSPRQGTPAADMEPKIPDPIKKKRRNKLIEINKKLMKNYQSKFINKVKRVVIEENRDSKTGMLTGVTDNYLQVLIDDNDSYKNKLKKVKIVKPYNYEKSIGKII